MYLPWDPLLAQQAIHAESPAVIGPCSCLSLLGDLQKWLAMPASKPALAVQPGAIETANCGGTQACWNTTGSRHAQRLPDKVAFAGRPQVISWMPEDNGTAFTQTHLPDV